MPPSAPPPPFRRGNSGTSSSTCPAPAGRFLAAYTSCWYTACTSDSIASDSTAACSRRLRCAARGKIRNPGCLARSPAIRSLRTCCACPRCPPGSAVASAHAPASLPAAPPNPVAPESTAQASLWLPLGTSSRRLPDSNSARNASGHSRLHAVVVIHLHAPVEGVHHINAILVVNVQSRRQLKRSRRRAHLSEVIQQLPFAIEHLHHAPHPVHHIQMSLRIEAHPLRPEHPPPVIPDLPDRVLKLPILSQHLHTEIHGVHHRHVVSIQPQLRRVIKFAIPRSRLADLLQHAAVHIHHENLIPQRVGHVNPLRRRIHSNPRWPFEVALAVLQAANGALVFSIRAKHENLPGFRIRHINIVLRVHRHTLRRHQRILSRIETRQKFVLLLFEIENVHAVRARIADDDATFRIRGDTVRSHQLVEVRLADHHVHYLGPKSPLRLHLVLVAEHALEAQLAPAVHQYIRHHHRRSLFLLILRPPCRAHQHQSRQHPQSRTPSPQPPAKPRSTAPR